MKSIVGKFVSPFRTLIQEICLNRAHASVKQDMYKMDFHFIPKFRRNVIARTIEVLPHLAKRDGREAARLLECIHKHLAPCDARSKADMLPVALSILPTLLLQNVRNQEPLWNANEVMINLADAWGVNASSLSGLHGILPDGTKMVLSCMEECGPNFAFALENITGERFFMSPTVRGLSPIGEDPDYDMQSKLKGYDRANSIFLMKARASLGRDDLPLFVKEVRRCLGDGNIRPTIYIRPLMPLKPAIGVSCDEACM